MIYNYLKNLFNFFSKYKNNYYINKLNKKIHLINSLESKFNILTNKEIYNKKYDFKNRIINGECLDSILIESFALVKEVCKRVLNLRLFDTQIMGGIVLNNGKIAEMSTGEGKTLSAILPAYFNSIKNNNVHIVTMNDYLAKRDSNNNKKIFDLLGITVGTNISGMSRKDKKMSYKCDVVYGTNSEYVFDYLKDNMILNKFDKIQKSLDYVIIDEIDSILIDEARTPLIISEQIKNNSNIYKKINKIVNIFIKNTLKSKHKYLDIDIKSKQVYLNEAGFKLFEKLIKNENLIKNKKDLYSNDNFLLIHLVLNSIKSYIFFKKNIDYIIDKNNNILIIDEHTGRVFKDRRWSEGIHQFIEAKENVNIKNENKILSSITIQNYFSLYKKLSGMTGTAYTEKEEFKQIYNLDVISIPTNKKVIRKDYKDLIFFTYNEKLNFMIKDIINRLNNNQPILIGTSSVEKSEIISLFLKKNNIIHNVLNAKFNELEAHIISQAGKPKSVTIATNMAGRGTDIILGGNYKNLLKINIKKKDKKEKIIKEYLFNKNIVIKSGGLHIIGTERYESRRIDNQLKGRAGRQGDPGSSQFYLSMEDDLIKRFVSSNIINILKSINVNNGKNEPMKYNWLNKSIEIAQSSIEKRNFDIRKQLILYDNIINNQRKIFYKIRSNILIKEKLNNIFYIIYKNFLIKIINKNFNNKLSIKHNLNNIEKEIKKKINLHIKINIKINNFLNDKNFKKIILLYIINKVYLFKLNFNLNKFFYIKKIIFLKIIDIFWQNHLENIDILKNNIFLRSYANKDPKQEYQIESFNLFKNMINNWEYESLRIFNIVIYFSKNKILVNKNNLINNKLLNYNEINNLIIYLI